MLVSHHHCHDLYVWKSSQAAFHACIIPNSCCLASNSCLHYHEDHSIGLSAAQSRCFLCKRPQALQFLNGTMTSLHVCLFALLQIQKEFATRLLASHLDLLLTLRYLRTSSCCPCWQELALLEQYKRCLHMLVVLQHACSLATCL